MTSKERHNLQNHIHDRDSRNPSLLPSNVGLGGPSLFAGDSLMCFALTCLSYLGLSLIHNRLSDFIPFAFDERKTSRKHQRVGVALTDPSLLRSKQRVHA